MARPDFRGHEHVVALDTGSAQALAYFALIFIELRRVDVPIAKPQRLLDHTRAFPAAQFPCAEAEKRDTRAFSLDNGARVDFAHGPSYPTSAPAAG